MNDFQIQGLSAASASVPLIIRDAQAMRAQALRDAVRAVARLFVSARNRASASGGTPNAA